jgi:hypothetical protein
MMGLEVVGLLIAAALVTAAALALRGWLGGWAPLAVAAPLVVWGWRGLARRRYSDPA